jgi:hypothetical protein
MTRPSSQVDEQLDASLRRIGNALKQSRTHYGVLAEQIAASRGASAAARLAESAARIEASAIRANERVATSLARSEARVAAKLERNAERQQRRAERRRRERESEAASGVPRGIVFLVVAVACLVTAFRQPAMFWMLFVALGFGMSAVGSFAAAARAGRDRAAVPGTASRSEEADATHEPVAEKDTVEPPPAAPPPVPPPVADAVPPDPKVARIQALCDKLLAELESGPPIVREVVTEPSTTIDGLRQACVQTAKRERELRSVLAAQDERALLAERDGLAARVASETDAIVRDRLSQALRALEQQLANRAELATAASRLEAENTRILYTLENLHMQLLRARSTDIGAPELGGKLRQSLRELGTQIDAVAEALEWASAPPASDAAAPASPPAADATAATVASQADAQRAEREAAARRAQAQQAQRM